MSEGGSNACRDGVIFQGFGGELTDKQVYEADLHLADLAEPLGYESIWSVEHHFTKLSAFAILLAPIAI